LLTHLIREKGSSLIVIDEPEVYLHADIQRQLIGLIRDFEADVVLATHSTEIMGESEPADLVLIDRRKKAGERIKNVESLQNALAAVGSVHNITLSRLAKSRRIVFFEGDNDHKILRTIARKLGFLALASGIEIVPAYSEGFGSWEKVAALGWGIAKALGEKLAIGAVYDRDFFCDEQVAHVEAQLTQTLSFAHIHRRKEIENYLLLLAPLNRALGSALADKEKREGYSGTIADQVEVDLLEITEKYRGVTASQRIGKEIDYKRSIGFKPDSATLHSQAQARFDEVWASLEGRLTLVPGKAVLAELRSVLSQRHGVTITNTKIISSMRPDDVPADFLNLLVKLEAFRKAG